MNKKSIVIIVGVVVIVGLVAAYFMMQPKASAPNEANNTSNSNTSEQSNNENGAASEESAIAIEITYTSAGFSPAEITVKKGETVKVVNNSDGTLEFSSADHPTHTKNAELNMSELDPGSSGTITPETAGTWGYHNHYAPNHTGKIVVTE